MASREGTQRYAKEKCGLRIGEAVSESSRRSTANAKCGNVARFPWRIPRLVFGLRNEQSGTGVSPVNDQTEERRAGRPYPTISIRALGICAGARALSSGILLSRMSKDFVWSESGGGSERGSEKGLGRPSQMAMDPSTPYKSWIRAASMGGLLSAYCSLAWRPFGNSYREGAN